MVIAGESPGGCRGMSWYVPGERQRLEVVDALHRAEQRLAVEPEVGHARREEGECLLELGPGEVVADAEVHTRAEGQQPGVGSLGSDVEVGGLDAVPVARYGADQEDRSRREDDVPVRDVRGEDACAERR